MTDNIELLIRHKAKLDINDAHNWYEIQREGLGDIFLEDFISCVNFICENPKSYPVILKEIRRALLKKFPYNVLYLISKNKFTILACFHSKEMRIHGKTEYETTSYFAENQTHLIYFEVILNLQKSFNKI